MDDAHIKTSKFLSLVLRHRPEAIGLDVDDGGWASVDDLITCAGQHGRSLSAELIQSVVTSNDKQRFALSEDGRRIRANQGHSITVDLDLSPVTPPERLYHGTVRRFLDSIRSEGLVPKTRTHVHLSPDHETALTVGKRRGDPIVLTIRTDAMHEAGIQFCQSENGVWLTDTVPPKFIEFPP